MNSKTDLQAIIDYLELVTKEAQVLKNEFEQVKQLEEENKTVNEDLKKTSLKKLIELFDRALERYQYFMQDAELNGIRTKKIATELLKQANQTGVDVEMLKKKSYWVFRW